MASGTQMVPEVKKNKLNNRSRWRTLGQKLDRSFRLRSFCVHSFILKILILYNYVGYFKLE